MNSVCVKESKIHGKGLFAARNILLGEKVAWIDLCNISPQYHPWNGKNGDSIPFFINHSCEANAVLLVDEVERALVVFTTRPILAGEEVTLDYFLTEVGGRMISCECSSRLCRGRFPTHQK